MNLFILSFSVCLIFFYCRYTRPEDRIGKAPQIIAISHCQLELGKWSVEAVNNMLKERRKLKNAGQALKYVACQFIDTPFRYESELKTLAGGTLRVRLKSFDCITFGHYMVALAISNDFDQFINNLVRLRYKDPEVLGVNSDPAKGNILDFTYNIYLENAVKRGIVKNVTDKILARRGLPAGRFTRVLRPLERKVELGGGLVVPKFGTRSISISYIKTEDVDKVMKYIKTGNIILFVQPAESNRPPTIFGHGAIAIEGRDLPEQLRKNIGISNQDKGIYFIHATSARDTRQRIIGVNIAGQQTYPDSLIYDSSKPRTLADYCIGVEWRGIVVLELISPF